MVGLKGGAWAALLSVLLTGCVLVAPNKYGPSGVVLPGTVQFDSYLANCCRRYPVLADSCERWGTPAAIQIGSSGGYFVWTGRLQWVRVKTFGAQVLTGAHPVFLRDFVGPVDGSAFAAPAYATRRTAVAAPVGGYAVERFERTSNDDFAYDFRLRLKDGADSGLAAMNRIKRELRQAVTDDYVATYGGGAGDVRVDFPAFAMQDAVVEGRAEVMRIAVQSLRYDAATKQGVIAVKIGANSFEDARKWVRRNIETLARDKNIALTTGQLPAEARFFLGAERIYDGNVLEIEFETE